MHQFNKILLYHEDEPFSPQALELACDVAKQSGARLTIVDVLEDFPLQGETASPLRQYKVIEQLKRRRNHELKQLVASVREKGVKTGAKLLMGNPFQEITREVLKGRHDLLIKTARGKEGISEILFGNTAMHLLRECPCAVWIMKQKPIPKKPRILAAVNPDPSNAKETELNRKIMRLALGMARNSDGELHVLHCWSFPLERVLRGDRCAIDGKELNQITRGIRKERRTRLDELLTSFSLGDLKHRIHLVKGDPGPKIPEFARKLRASLIVMGTVCRTGLAGFLIGNTAETVLRQVDCSVLTVKPDGFVSSVALEQM